MASISVGRVHPLPSQAQLAIGETFIPAFAPSLAPHRHPSAQLHLVLEGKYRESSRGTHFELGPGSALFRPARELHGNNFCGVAIHGLLVDIEPDFAGRLLPGLDVSTPSYFPEGTFDDLRSAFARERKQDPSERHMMLHALALNLAARMSRQARFVAAGRPVWVEQAAALIRKRYSEDVRLAALSDEMGIAPSTLAAGFRRYLGQSVGEFLIEVRLQRAHSAIIESEASLSDVAVSCGFYDQAHLTRAIRRRYGTTPARLRHRLERTVQN